MAKLDHPFPSSPSRPPKFHISFIHTRGDRLLQSVGFGAIYSARKFIDTVVGESEIKWRGDDAFHVEDLDITVKGTGLEDIMEHDLTKAEEDWELPDPYLGDATSIATGERRKLAPPKRMSEADAAEDHKKQRGDAPAKAERKASKPRASVDGLTTLAQICEDIGMEPREARVILRKSDTKKPDAGWAWDPKEAAKVKATLSGKGKDNGGDKTPTGKRGEAEATPTRETPAPAKGKAKRKTRR